MSDKQTINETLSQQDKAIISIAGFAASGEIESLRNELVKGLDKGLGVDEIKGVLSQLYAYCGFPRSLNALGTFMGVVQTRKDAGILDEAAPTKPLNEQINPDSLSVGTANQTKLIGQVVAGPLFDFAPEVDAYLKAHLFGDIFSKTELTWRQRELATIAALANLKGAESQLKSHYFISLNNSVTVEQLHDFVSHVKATFAPEVGVTAESVLKDTLS